MDIGTIVSWIQVGAWPSLSRLERQTEIPFRFCGNYRNGIIRRDRWPTGLLKQA